LWRIDPLLGNDSVNTFPRKRTSAKIRHLLLGNGSVNKQAFSTIEGLCFLRGPRPRGYKGTKKVVWLSSCRELDWVLEVSVEGGWEEMAGKKWSSEKLHVWFEVTVGLL
jgi:hypothetical protein